MRVRGGPASARDPSPGPAHLRPDVEAGAEPAAFRASNTALGRTLSSVAASCAALSSASKAGASTVLVLTRILPDGRSWGTLPAARLLAAVLGTPASLAARPGVAPSAGRLSTGSTLSPSCMRAPRPDRCAGPTILPQSHPEHLGKIQGEHPLYECSPCSGNGHRCRYGFVVTDEHRTNCNTRSPRTIRSRRNRGLPCGSLPVPSRS